MNLKDMARPGDILCQYDNPFNTDWQNSFNFPWITAYVGICGYQSKMFGNNADVKFDHVITVLDADHCLNAKPPLVGWSTLDQLATGKFKVFRPTFHTFTEAEAQSMIQEFTEPVNYKDADGVDQAFTMIGSPYQYQECLDMLTNAVLGNPDDDSIQLFDGKGTHVVCSTSAGIFYEKFRLMHGSAYQPLFTTPNVEKFKRAEWCDMVLKNISKLGKMDVRMYPPAIFANSDFFQNEFELVGQNF